MIHNMKLRDEPFAAVREGRKDIELRLYDEKRKLIQKGDLIIFKNTDSGESLACAVLALHVYDSFEKLYADFDKLRLGYSAGDIADPADMEKYYSPESIAEYGVLGIEIRLLSRISAAELVDNGIYPTCFDKQSGAVLYGDMSDKMIFKDDK